MRRDIESVACCQMRFACLEVLVDGWILVLVD